MDKQQFWQLIEAARNQASNPNDGEAVARKATSLLASRPIEEIVANGGCSDDGFDYFRGWLIAQGREVF